MGTLLNVNGLFAQEVDPAELLPAPVKQVALMALLGIALLGMMLIVGTLLGGHWVRRWGDRQRRSAVPPDVTPTQQDKKVTPELPSGDFQEGDTLGGDETIVS